MVLPEVIQKVVDTSDTVSVPNDTVIQELGKISELFEGATPDLSMAAAVYMLGFGSYQGFKQLSEENEADDIRLKRLYEYAKQTMNDQE